MSRITTDRTDPRLHHGTDTEQVDQAEVYLVLSKEERFKGFIRPYRNTYWHTVCDKNTSMGRDIAETYARNPTFYNSTYCCTCRKHSPVAEFRWYDAAGNRTQEVLGT